MARLRTREDLTNYVLRKLGAPILRVELTRDQIQDNIDYAIKEFSTFAYDGDLKEVVILSIDNRGYYNLPDFVTSVLNVRSILGYQTYGANYIPDRWSEQYFQAFETTGMAVDAVISISSMQTLFEKYVMREIHYTFNEYKSQLHITEDYVGKIAVEYTMEYVPDEQDKIYNQQWIKDYAVALCRVQQGTNTGKYSSPLVGGSTVNYDDMKSKGEADIDKLKEELFLKYAGPAPIDIA